jgi:sulfide:quinone oxidoreductase
MIGKKVTDALTVSQQIQADDIEAIKAGGFRSILCNRPDNEEPGQPTFAEIEAAAKAAGIEIRHQPVISGRLTQEDVEGFKEAVGEMPEPVFAYCRSGTRCITLWALAASAEKPMEEVLEIAKQAGYNLGGG